MRRAAISWVIVAAAVLWILPLAQAARVGERAPDFSVADTNGKMEKLIGLRGEVRGIGVEQPRLSRHAKALQQREYAAAATGVDSTLTCTLLIAVPTAEALSTAHPETVTCPIPSTLRWRINVNGRRWGLHIHRDTRRAGVGSPVAVGRRHRDGVSARAQCGRVQGKGITHVRDSRACRDRPHRHRDGLTRRSRSPRPSRPP